MQQIPSEQELKEIARQLSCPQGEAGIAMGENMNLNNIGMTRASITALQLKGGESVLELGHGNCGHLETLLSAGDGITYQGLEISAEMQQAAQQKNTAAVAEDIAHFDLYDGTTISFEDNRFDMIFTVNTIYFWEDAPALLTEIARVLKPNGKCIITFADKSFMEQLPFTQYGFNLFDKGRFSALIEESPLQVADFIDKDEWVTSKSGQEVNRHFIVALLNKK
ncbi:class I SAM-dependent methyltransferase [Flavobacterium psychrotrophum]|uniref:class I SAM-dependent methyltransferase n=1 Tax=Flavobacterium psychrotrophum TaxID=2294119 RepID=UPI000E31C898|nr:class I SAM-dependent methyltransferase [Flavobacterium psychrotrophum]